MSARNRRFLRTLLLGVAATDTPAEADWLADKNVHLRTFEHDDVVAERLRGRGDLEADEARTDHDDPTTARCDLVPHAERTPDVGIDDGHDAPFPCQGKRWSLSRRRRCQARNDSVISSRSRATPAS